MPQTDLSQKNTLIVDALKSILPADVACSGGTIDAGQHALFPEEETAVSKAVAKRRTEFTAGRTYARKAIADLGGEVRAIPRASDRRPEWPEGIVGTISHSKTQCVAAVASSMRYSGLGIDIAPAEKLKPNLYAHIARPEERQDFHLPVQWDGCAIDRGMLVFSIKEALFKAYYPATQHFLGFQQARVTFCDEVGHVTATIFEAPALNGKASFDGRIAIAEGHIVSAVTIAADSP